MIARLLISAIVVVVVTTIAAPALAQDPVAGAAAGLQQEALPPVSATVPMVVFTTIWNAIDGRLQAATLPVVAAVADRTRAWVTAGLTLWLAFYCIGALFPTGSGGSMFFTGLFKELLQGAVAITIIQIYADTVVPAIQNLPGELANLFASNGSPPAGAGVAAAFDQLWNTTRALGHLIETRIPDSLRPSILVEMFLIPIMQSVGFVFIAWAFFIVLCTHMITTVLLVAGTIFIGMAAVPVLRKYAWGWVSSLLSTIATVAFLALILGVTINVITDETKILAALPETTDILDQIDGFLGVIGCLFLLGTVVTVMPFVSIAIFGGVHNSLSGAANAASAMGGAAAGGVGKLARATR